MSNPGIDETDEVIKTAEKLSPLPPPRREVVDMMYEILDKNCTEADYDSKWKTVRDLVGLWQKRENVKETDIQDINRRLAARKVADEYQQKRTVLSPNAEYNAGYNAALDDMATHVRSYADILDKTYRQETFGQLLYHTMTKIVGRTAAMKRHVLCDKCKRPMKWLTCATEACHKAK